MKKQRLNLQKKLSLGKTIVSSLNDEQQNGIVGASTVPACVQSKVCASHDPIRPCVTIVPNSQCTCVKP